MNRQTNRKATFAHFFFFLLILFLIKDSLVAQSLNDNHLSYVTRIDFIPENVTDNYIQMLVDRYDYVMTANQQVASKIRSFSETIQIIYYFDTPFSPNADFPESYYAHSSESTNPNQRIKHLDILFDYNTYFMDIFSQEWKDQIVQILELAFQNEFDCAMMDECGPEIESNIDFFPDDYPGLDGYMEELGDLLEYVKSHFPENTIVFNGLLDKLDNNNIEFLEFMDGGFREGFVFNIFIDTFLEEVHYITFLDSVIQNTQNKIFIANTKITLDRSPTPQERLYAFGSFLLIAHDEMVYNLIDWMLVDLNNKCSFVQYYPEMDISLGMPIQTAQESISELQRPESHLYEREFENGWVLVNPSDNTTYIRSFENMYLKVIPVGGGLLNETDNGHLEYEEIDQISLEPKQGAILLKNMPTDLNINTSHPDQYVLLKNYPNPAENYLTIEVSDRTYIELIDSKGNIIMNYMIDANNGTINLNNLPRGIYLIKASIGGKTGIKRLIIQ